MTPAVETGRVRCRHCEKEIVYPLAKAGLTGKCPNCKHPLTLPKQELITTDKPQATLIVAEREDEVLIARRADEEPAELRRFMAEGQNVAMVIKLLERVREICTSMEEPTYMAVQQKPVANLHPDAVVLTNRRVIIFRQRVFGRMDFVDVPWLYVAGIHLQENIIGATIFVDGTNGHREAVDYIPKDQARRVYRIGQEHEEAMVELRRQRRMEEQRNAANQVVVNNAVHTQPAAAAAGDDPVAKLAKLRALLDAGLISQQEFDSTKAQILSHL